MNYPRYKLGDVAQVVTGSTPSKSREVFWGGSIPFVTPTELDGDEPVSKAAVYVTDLGAVEARVVPVNSIMVCCIGSLGKVGIAGCDLITNQQINTLIFDESKVYFKYGYHFCKTLKPYLDHIAPSTTVAIVNKSRFSEIEIPLPPLEEQKRIAAILDKADSLRRKRAQAIALADDFLRVTFLEMFGDPVTNPKGFTRRLMKEFYANESDGTKCGPFGSALKKDEYKQSGIPVWNMDNISLTGDFFDDPKLWVAEGKFNDLASYSVKNGDVIISRAGTVGKMGVVHTKHEKSLLSTNLIRVRFNSKLKPEFFVALMTYCKGRVSRLKVGPDGAFTHMNVGIIDSIEFPYPPIALQENFLTIVNRIKRQISKNVVFQEKLNEMHFAISQIAFSESGNK